MYSFAGGGTVRMSARPDAGPTARPSLHHASGAKPHSWLEQTWRDPLFADAVELASPALSTRVRALLTDPQPCPRATRRAARSSLRYLLRFSSRATPFGLFAGIAPLEVGDVATARIGTSHRAVARVEHRWITAVVQEFLRHPDRAHQVVVDGRTFVRDGRLVLADAASPSTPPWSSKAGCREVSVRFTAPVAVAVRRAREPVTRSELFAGLAGDFPGASAEAIDRMISALLAQGFLVGALAPPMTAPDPLAHVLGASAHARVEDRHGVMAELRTIGELIGRHDTASTAADQRDLRAAVIPRMRALAETTTPLGADLVLDADITVPRTVMVEAADAAAALVRLAAELNGPAAWRDYHRRFLDRYGIGAMIPLPQLLHAGTGLGYPAGYRGTHIGPVAAPHGAHARRRAELLTRLAYVAVWDRRQETELTDADLDALTEGIDVVPQPHTELRVEVHAPTRAALGAGRFHLLVVGASRAAGTVTGRFLDLLDPDGTGPVTTALRGLPTATRGATRVQLSGPPAAADAATITRSPAVLDRQIVVGGPAPAGSLLPKDLAVSADAAGLYLVIAATGEPIEATTFTALELVRCADPTLRFLAEIATSSCTPCSPLLWEPALRELPFLPRVRYQRTVLSPARWTVRAADLPPDATPTAWRGWQDRWAVPDRVLLGRHDQRLGLDLTEPAHRGILLDTLHRTGRVTLLDAPAPDAFGWADDHAHELVLPLATTHVPRHPGRPRTTALSCRPRHTPGTSRWLYARFACRPDHQTAVLTEHLPQLLTDLDNLRTAGTDVAETEVAASAWFLRLTEPDHHLRLRVRLRHARHFGRAAAHVATWADRLTNAGLIGGVEFHTYLPETGRFGEGPAQRGAETVFAADSTAALAQLAVTASDAGPDAAGDVLTAALTAASIVDLVTGLTDGPREGWDWLIRHAPRTITPAAGRTLRACAIDLAHPGRRHLAELPGGDGVIAAWDRRRAALVRYRQTLLVQGIDPLSVLPDLLHLHHARAIGPHLDREAACLNLARTAALSHRARATHATPAA